MKKFLKIMAILVAVGTCVAAVIVYLKDNGYICNCKDDCCNEEDEFAGDDCEERNYVSISSTNDKCECDDCDCEECECDNCDCESKEA